MLQRLFVYGTLKDPLIQAKVIGRELSGESDSLCGYRLGSVSFGNKTYPAVTEDESCEKPVLGIVLLLTDKEIERADLYEGSYYQRKEVFLKSKTLAYAYVLNTCSSAKMFD